MTSFCLLQRRLLERLVAVAASVIGSQVPLAAVTLETLGLLLEILGEVPPETAQLLRVPLTQKLTCQHSLLRMQVINAQTHRSLRSQERLLKAVMTWQPTTRPRELMQTHVSCQHAHGLSSSEYVHHSRF